MLSLHSVTEEFEVEEDKIMDVVDPEDD